MEFKNLNKRLIFALAAYLLLALIATFALEGVLRTAVWFFFIILAAKTIAASQRED